MMPTPGFLRDAPASASGFPVSRTACCCSTPHRHNSLPVALALVAPFSDIGVDLYVADGSMIQPSTASGTAAEVKSP
jgi:hypothetical protein